MSWLHPGPLVQAMADHPGDAPGGADQGHRVSLRLGAPWRPPAGPGASSRRPGPGAAGGRRGGGCARSAADPTASRIQERLVGIGADGCRLWPGRISGLDQPASHLVRPGTASGVSGMGLSRQPPRPLSVAPTRHDGEGQAARKGESAPAGLAEAACMAWRWTASIWRASPRRC